MTAFFSKNQAPKPRYGGQFSIELVGFIASIPEAKQAFPGIEQEAKAVSAMTNIKEREVVAAELYTKIEAFLVSNYSFKYTANSLRDEIRKKYHPERMGEGAALIFVNADMRAVALFRIFENALVFRAQQAYGRDTFVALMRDRFADQHFAAAYIKNGEMSWQETTDLLVNVPQGEQKLRAQEFFSHFNTFLMNMLRDKIQDARTQLVLQDLYRNLKREYRFLDDFPIILSIITDQNILRDERVGMLSRTELAEQSRMQTKKIEETLAELQHEKEQLVTALRDLEISQEKLRALDRAKGQFIDVVSHQFRTPLSTIRWSSELLRENFGEKIGKDGKTYLDNVRHKSMFLINILNDIFDVLSVEGEMLNLQKKPTQLWEIIEDKIRMMEAEAAQHNVKLVFEKSTNALKEVMLDQSIMQRALEILIRNAINYSHDGGQVIIKMGEEMIDNNNYVWAEISDSGIGISSEDLPKIFTKFFRASNAIQKVPDGAGLGLYIVRNIIEQHGGRVAVTSELNKGFTFRFYIPDKI
ncbi:MAG: hypothetical protein A3A80_02760 [Candidatus Terrybacteria bacterium RIFCSPLOWO2_01_FULL_44_24]|uniref:histidine kinase n=1 Tax=Candidatus Terrybacteria bacterium RIFCSPHIGHO2_01_FULL_43_35 TaxID=1802361 RepID=A0A1G2PGP1_9BACT|nr:MAG: hypothetical protein A2828_02550 [Candidatus Terrybacteria bacterium RIFCSPHIGHO2_01_FULL_43_35]OHA50259.1 MAG: hypothetical protein A3B75_00450 [Candidatus Terrybacteria bacterium RIFCSPHIGHO2_02_FULL_43_14]OHA50990.1 MAG: hypothetical protein A3A80_02760 [Candidatus Terrybacteria bacterium RIFCSPLOWO2_01_FULL_44_24]